MERWAELRREHFVGGVSIRELARRTGLSRNTVRGALRSDAPPAFRCPERPSRLDPFKDEIHRLLRADPDLPAVRVREEIAALPAYPFPRPERGGHECRRAGRASGPPASNANTRPR